MASLAKPHASRRPSEGLLLLPVAVFLALACLALGYVAHILWPRWSDASLVPGAPPLPIVVAGVAFNIPPAAIRVAVQRRAGVQERLDLVYLWPTLVPPEPEAKPTPEAPSPTTDRVFVTVAASGGILLPSARLATIYPRYVAAPPATRPDGLAFAAFRDGSPYQGEDLAYDPSAPDRFLARCSRNTSTRGTCLAERRIGDAGITVRFPRDWISDWRNVADGIDRLVMEMQRARG
jgi:hypothetical protein